MRQKHKRRWMTLIEVLIASSLLTVLLTALMGIYYEMTISHKKIQQIHEEAFKRRYMQNRLTQVFSNIEETVQQNYKTFLFTSDSVPGTVGTSLVFSMENCAERESKLSGYTFCNLYVNNQHQLCLAIWSGAKEDNIPEHTPPSVMKTEVLLDNVSAIKFLFYAPPTDASTDPQIPQYDAWNSGSWKKEYPNFPAIVHLEVTTQTDQKGYEYQFALPYIKSNIIYRR